MLYYYLRLLIPIVIYAKPGFHWVRYGFYGKYESLCSQFSFVKFPFDKQTCEITFYSDEPTYHFNINETNIFIDPSSFTTETTIWTLEGTNIWTGFYDDKYFSVWIITVEMTFQRKYQYYIGNIFLPFFGLYFIQLFALLLPPDLTERPAISVTVNLAYVFILTSVFDLIPRTTEVVYLVVLLEIQLFISIFLTCYMLFSCAFVKRLNDSPIKAMATIHQADKAIGLFSIVVVLASDSTLIILMAN